MMDPIVRRLFENKVEEIEETPDQQYMNYLEKHRDGVRRVYQETLLPVLLDQGIDAETLNKIEYNIDNHDISKYDPVEFIAYRNHFYDPKNHPRSGSKEYDYAWNHHQKSNPHHWNYWVMINDVDKPQVHPLDMPFEYIIEMLCDWQSAGHHYGNSAYDWYSQNGKNMLLSENTRHLVEKYIGYLK